MQTAQEALAREPLHCGAQVRLASCCLARGQPGDLALAEVLPVAVLTHEGCRRSIQNLIEDLATEKLIWCALCHISSSQSLLCSGGQGALQ